MENKTDYDMRCQGCKKTPTEIDEYVVLAKLDDMTPEKFVLTEEGTFNIKNGHFLCTECYIKAGMPTGPKGERWICP
jgi:hypothetical protein